MVLRGLAPRVMRYAWMAVAAPLFFVFVAWCLLFSFRASRLLVASKPGAHRIPSDTASQIARVGWRLAADLRLRCSCLEKNQSVIRFVSLRFVSYPRLSPLPLFPSFFLTCVLCHPAALLFFFFFLQVPGISATPYEDNLRYFNVVITGPEQSPYESERRLYALRQRQPAHSTASPGVPVPAFYRWLVRRDGHDAVLCEGGGGGFGFTITEKHSNEGEVQNHDDEYPTKCLFLNAVKK